jgi:(3R)-3-hydroxyacyl-CoA dehydrogenase / 3a,7a,12a-trihydroxy-5b-cholest-24-enoyl-CoA hydratase / enoyl-CoA hydratase 2
VLEISTQDENGNNLARNELSMLVRGAGGWGGDRGPQADTTSLPTRAPDAVTEELVHPNQALYYRLTGDSNPLHADPDFAKAFGFDKPILHGLCTMGIATRHVLRAFCNNNAGLFKSVRVRFAESVFPGETLITEMWKDGNSVTFQTKVKERDKVVLSAARIELFTEVPKAPAKAIAKAAVDASAAAAPSSTDTKAACADVFVAIRDYVEKNSALIKQIGVVYTFKLKDPESVWTLDLKNGSGLVAAGPAEAHGVAAECTLELTSQDFLDMVSGKADAQKLYFSKRLGVSGNIMASQKLTFLKQMDPEAAKAAVAKAKAAGQGLEATASSGAVTASIASALFAALQTKLDGKPAMALAKTLQFNVDGSKYPVAGASTDVGATITLNDAALEELAKGASPGALFQQGKLRVDGDVNLARNLDFLHGLV